MLYLKFIKNCCSFILIWNKPILVTVFCLYFNYYYTIIMIYTLLMIIMFTIAFKWIGWKFVNCLKCKICKTNTRSSEIIYTEEVVQLFMKILFELSSKLMPRYEFYNRQNEIHAHIEWSVREWVQKQKDRKKFPLQVPKIDSTTEDWDNPDWNW